MRKLGLEFWGILTVLLIFMMSPLATFAGLAENKKLVKDFYDLAFNQHQAKKAAELYLTEDYIQHNPFVATGRKPFIEAFAHESASDPSRTIFVRFIAEDDLVVLHSHKVPKPGDKGGKAGVDIFRVKDGKITEHWDVNQDIPAKIPHDNTMF